MSKSRPSVPGSESPDMGSIVRRHLKIGWWSLLVFLMLGIGLEALHGFKIGAYLGVSNETRRFMWTLAHAHGTLLGLLNLGFSSTLRALPQWNTGSRGVASACLSGATLLMPAGFFLGGVNPFGGDPGVGILLLPVGAFLLLVAVLCAALAASRIRE